MTSLVVVAAETNLAVENHVEWVDFEEERDQAFRHQYHLNDDALVAKDHDPACPFDENVVVGTGHHQNRDCVCRG